MDTLNNKEGLSLKSGFEYFSVRVSDSGRETIDFATIK